MQPLHKRRFDALAGYTRRPFTAVIVRELEWYRTPDERLLGAVTLDNIDHDFGWVLLARDAGLRFRCIDVNTSRKRIDIARRELRAAMELATAQPQDAFFQGDEPANPVDFFTPNAPPERLSPLFRNLIERPGYSPARGVIEAMMRYHEDADGNFVEQFQTAAFDARLWELYLFAMASELGYAKDPAIAIPDLVLTGWRGQFAVEAVTVNPTQGDPAVVPDNHAGLVAYQENYIPIRLARALRRKLERDPPYWQLPEVAGMPFVLAIQDFHAPGIMRAIASALTEYAFGYRHSIRDGNHVIERIVEHRWGNAVEASDFFSLPGSEHVSALIANPQGTLPKFNRLGYSAGFGDRAVRMTKRGFRRGEREGIALPIPFHQDVADPAFNESWTEGLVVLHNPNAVTPLDPLMLEGAAHEFLQEGGRLLSLIPDFHPMFSETLIVAPES